METTLKVLLLMGDQLVRFGAFIAIFYFVVALYRARTEGAPYLLFGCIAVLLGEFSKMTSFTGIWPGEMWLPALLLTAFGYCSAAYGFAKLVRAVIKRKCEAQDSV
jgi:hypothetical protein